MWKQYHRKLSLSRTVMAKSAKRKKKRKKGRNKAREKGSNISTKRTGLKSNKELMILNTK